MATQITMPPPRPGTDLKAIMSDLSLEVVRQDKSNEFWVLTFNKDVDSDTQLLVEQALKKHLASGFDWK